MTARLVGARRSIHWFRWATAIAISLLAASVVVGDPLGPSFGGRVVAVELILVALLIRHGLRPLAWPLIWVACLRTLLVIVEDYALRSGAGPPPTAHIAPVFMGLVAVNLVGLLWAADPGRRLGHWVLTFAAVLVAWTVIGSIVGFAGRLNDPSWLIWIESPLWVRLATVPSEGGGVWTIFILPVLALAGDARRVVPRLVHRIRTDQASWPSWPLVVMDELLPGREAGRAAAAQAERLRFASDVHAEVLPALNMALAESAAGATADRIAARLRDLEHEVRGLVADRRLVILEEFGIVHALEWLAERVEDRSAARVELFVAADAADGPIVGSTEEATDDRPPRDVERSAFRVAQLAVDNAILHAAPARIGIDVVVAHDRLLVSVADDGPGLTATDRDRAARANRQGIADMRWQADSVHARLEIETAAPGGTTVVFDWTAP